MPEINNISYARTSKTVAGLSGATVWSGGKDSAGNSIGYPQNVEGWEADATISRGQIVKLVAATSTAPIRVTPCADADLGYQCFGVAVEDAVAGDVVRIATDRGYCRSTTTIADALPVQTSASGVVEDASATTLETGAATSAVGYSVGAAVADYFGSGVYGVFVQFV